MPMTSPFRLKVGPPELPRLIGASICRKSSNWPAWMSRPRAEMMPVVTEPPSPNGLPAALAHLPVGPRLRSAGRCFVKGLLAVSFEYAVARDQAGALTVAAG